MKKWIQVRKEKCMKEYIKGETIGVAPCNIVIGGTLGIEPYIIKKRTNDKQPDKSFLKNCTKVRTACCDNIMGEYLAYYIKG